MKCYLLIVGLLVLSSANAAFLKKTETGSCQVYYTWYSYTPVTPVTTVSVVDTVYPTYYYPLYYSPYVWYTYYYRKGEKVDLTVINDHDLKSYDVKDTKVLERDDKNKETWYTGSKTDEAKAKEAYKSCKGVQEEARKKNFENIKSKLTKSIPKELVPKEVVFKNAPAIKANPNAKPDEFEGKVEIRKEKVEEKKEVKVEEKKSEEKKPEEKKVEKERKSEEKKSEEKKPEEKKVEKKAEEKK